MSSTTQCQLKYPFDFDGSPPNLQPTTLSVDLAFLPIKYQRTFIQAANLYIHRTLPEREARFEPYTVNYVSVLSLCHP